MKILTDYDDLTGKTIVFSHMPQFAKQITLATEDHCILMATFEYSEIDEESTLRILKPHSVINVLKTHDWLRNELGKLGVFDIEKFNEEERIKQEQLKEERRLKLEQKERLEYERLKLKFENQTPNNQ